MSVSYASTSGPYPEGCTVTAYCDDIHVQAPATEQGMEQLSYELTVCEEFMVELEDWLGEEIRNVAVECAPMNNECAPMNNECAPMNNDSNVQKEGVEGVEEGENPKGAKRQKTE